MNDAKYIGLDVHQATISATVLDSTGKLVMESILETKAETILQFVSGLRGSLHVTFEEGTCAAWLHDLFKPRIAQVLVCDPRKNALLKVGNKNDRIDSRKLAELLRSNLLRSVFHENTGLRTMKELARSYMTITKDLTRVMVRLKALYRSWAVPCAGQQVYAPRHRAAWLEKITEACAAGPRCTISSSTRYCFCTSKCGESCWPRAESTTPRSCCDRFPRSARSVRLSYSRFYKHRTGFAPSGNSGPTAAWR
jgi:hypothetical protein